MTAAGFTLRELSSEAFARLAAGQEPAPGLSLPDPALASPEVLAMLAGISDALRPEMSPNAWILLDGMKVVVLCSIIRMIAPGVPMIGYGTAPGEQGRGAATAAVAGVLAWARANPVIRAVSAETAIGNLPSQRVLDRNEFRVTGRRVDPEDGQLLCWEWTKD